MTSDGKEFRKRNEDLFRGFSFSFQGFAPKDSKDYEKIVKILGAEVKANADYTFAEPSTELMKDKKYYHSCYILHSMREEKALDIKEFRLHGKDAICKLCFEEFETDSSDEVDDNITPNIDGKVEIINFKKIKIDPVESSNTINLNTKGQAISVKMFKNNNNKIKSPSTSNVRVKEENNEVEKVVINHEAKHTKIDDSDSSDSEFSFSEYEKEFSDEEDEQNDAEFKNWWLSQNVPKNRECKIRSCSLEPEVHYKHGNFHRNLILDERRVLLKYLIKTHKIHAAKTNSVYEEMNANGYLTHRTSGSLRNCFRRRILPRIDDYNLPNDIKEKFKAL